MTRIDPWGEILFRISPRLPKKYPRHRGSQKRLRLSFPVDNKKE